MKTLNCQHQFHNRCLNQWMELNKECPICLYNNNNEEYGKKVWNIQLQFHLLLRKSTLSICILGALNQKIMEVHILMVEVILEVMIVVVVVEIQGEQEGVGK